MNNFTIEEVKEIKKDLKKIKVTNFKEDYEIFKKALPQMFQEKEFHRHHGIYRITGLGKIIEEVYKAKKIRCTSLQSNRKFRVIFQVYKSKILIIEVYFKGKKTKESKERIIKYCKEN
jgi:hypothetical protein